MSSSNCCFLTWIQISQEMAKEDWYSHLFQIFPQFVVIHTVKGFGIVNKAEVFFFWNSLAFSILKLGGVIFAYLTCLSVALSFIIKQIPIFVIFYNKNHEVLYRILKFQQQWDEWWSSTLLNAFKRNFHQASDLIFREFSVSGINPSAEKSFNLFFSSIDHWYNLMTLLCLIRNDKHKEKISSFQSSLCFSFLTFPVLLASWNYKFASQILYSRHFAFQCLCQSRISWPQFPWVTEKSSIFIALFLNLSLKPFHIVWYLKNRLYSVHHGITSSGYNTLHISWAQLILL